MRSRWRTWTCSALLLAALPAAAQDWPLYRCSVIVTGTDMRTRPDGLARCVRQVLVKLSGDPTLADDPRLPAIEARADTLVQDLIYLDRMSDKPLHDEQGTRDRPFDLIAHLDPGRAAAALASLDRRPWPGPRPPLLLQVEVTDQRGLQFSLAGDGVHGERMRQALFSAGETYGMRVALPPAEVPGARPLQGTLRWSDADYGWVATWRIAGADPWEVRGVSFDAAFRAGVGGAARVLSR